MSNCVITTQYLHQHLEYYSMFEVTPHTKQELIIIIRVKIAKLIIYGTKVVDILITYNFRQDD